MEAGSEGDVCGKLCCRCHVKSVLAPVSQQKAGDCKYDACGVELRGFLIHEPQGTRFSPSVYRPSSDTGLSVAAHIAVVHSSVSTAMLAT